MNDAEGIRFRNIKHFFHVAEKDKPKYLNEYIGVDDVGFLIHLVESVHEDNQKLSKELKRMICNCIRNAGRKEL